MNPSSAVAENELSKPRGKRMRDSELKAMLDSLKMSSLASVWSSKLAAERDDALMYYMQDMSKDMPSMDGRSNAVSSDVADTIDGLMPDLMDIFIGGDEVVKFNPVGPEDVQAAQQETDYINHVFMQENDGFLILYSFIKDALLSKVGIVKAWWEENEEIEDETYHDLTDDELDLILEDKEVQILEHTMRPVDIPIPAPVSPPQPPGLLTSPMQAQQSELPSEAPGRRLPAPQGAGGGGPAPGQMPPPAPLTRNLHDVKVQRVWKKGRVVISGLPPEEFGIEKTARKLTTHECNYCFHRKIETVNRLLEKGYDRDIINSLPTYTAITMPEEINRDTVSEHQNVGSEHNPDTRRCEVVEHYVRMDYDGNGRAKLYKVCSGASEGQLLYKDGKLDIEEVDDFPFSAMTPIIMPHRFFGRSIADVILEIQRIKTALLRALLDNAYLANNPRVEVAEANASENTLDDLLISRPGGIVRTKVPGGLIWQAVPTIGQHVYPLLQYQDDRLEKRTGVTEASQGLNPDTLQNTSATAAHEMYNMAQKRMRLIARVLAETGIKDLFLKVHALIRKHGQHEQTIRLRNNWVKVDPRDWRKRNDLTVNVGLGTGGKAQQMAAINMIAGAQEKALMGGLTNLVTPQNLFETGKEIAMLAGYKNVERFFTDPSTQPPPQAPHDPKLQIEMLKIQSQNQLQDKKMQQEQVHEQAKFQADAALEQQKFQHQKELDYIEMGMKHEENQLKLQHMSHEHQLKTTEMANNMLMAQHQASLDQQTAQHQMQMQSQNNDHQMRLERAKAAGAGTPVDENGADAVTSLMKQMQDQHAQHSQSLTEALKRIHAPRRIVRDAKGRASHVETVENA